MGCHDRKKSQFVSDENIIISFLLLIRRIATKTDNSIVKVK